MMKKINYFAFWLCLIILGIFILQLLIPNFTENFVLNNKAYTQPWRFVSAIFLHGGISHLLYNLFALALFGFILEKLIGSWRFLLVFFASGIMANIISVNFYNSSLGASGAIMGIMGCITVLRPKMFVWTFGVPMPMFFAAVVWILGDIIGVFVPDNIGNIAHLSGIIIGFLFGFYFYNLNKLKKNHKNIEIPDSVMKSWEKIYMNN